MLLKNPKTKKYFYAENNNLALNWERFNEKAENQNNLIKFAQENKELFNCIFAGSSYLSENIIKDCEYWNDAVIKDADALKKEIFENTEKSWQNSEYEKLTKELRINKMRIATLTGIMDISGVWQVMDVTKVLSEFAGLACHSALNHCITNIARRGGMEINENDADPAKSSGFTILGMGKLGGYELNYSSDIDLIAFYDAELIKSDDMYRFQELSVKEFKKFITIMENIDAFGYVFRTDFRLRPNPSMTPIIMSKNAMLQYYETMGLNWERSAMIKARPIAGNIDVGNKFLDDIRPFIWRKNLDFEALEDIYSIKTKINKHRNCNDLKLAGHNVKLGLGGIREIEFYAQSHQLIWGGRINELRLKETLATLNELVNQQQITKDTAEKLTNSYLYLRNLEHRLQMVADKQTHTIPETAEGIEQIAYFTGFETVKDFEKETLNHMQNVADIYTSLFSEKNISQNKTTNTVENTFKDIEKINSIVEDWQSGIYRCTRSDRAKHLLNDITPQILNTFSKQSNPDDSLMLFDNFLQKLPAGVQLFSLFKSNPKLLDTIAKIISNAPRLSQKLLNKTSLLDILLTKRYLKETPSEEKLQEIIENYLNDCNDFQDVMEAVREFCNEMFFEQGVRVLENHAKPREVISGLSRIADVSIKNVIPNVIRNMQYSYGDVDGADFAIIAFGKLGSKELMPRSDLDMVFVCDYADGNVSSNGKRSLSQQEYYTRLFQRIINSIETKTANSNLFEVDVRLRPNGKSGSLAPDIDTFEKYYTEYKAWRWEFMALTNARVIYSTSDKLTQKLEGVIKHNISKKFNNDDLDTAIIEMRQTMENEFYDGVAWYVKHRPGGMVDIEFIIQGLKLKNAHSNPDILQMGNLNSLSALYKAGLLETDEYETLSTALQFYYDIQGIIRLTTESRFTDKTATSGQIDALLKVTEFDNLEKLQNEIETISNKVRNIFNKKFKGK